MRFLTIIMVLTALFLIGGCASTPEQEVSTPDEAPGEETYVEENNAFLEVVERRNNFSITTSTPEYFEDTTGYLARPEAPGEYPGVVMIHEWWGLNDNIKNMADVLASEGYVVLAVDLYDGEIATNASRAGELSGSINESRALENMQAAVSFLEEQEGTQNIASLGWCFGGDRSVQLSLSETRLDATLVYYGDVPTNASAVSRMDGPVFGVFGTEDQVVPVTSVREFETLLSNGSQQTNINIYDGVGHAFANPSSSGFAPNETRDSWSKTLDFLEQELKGDS